MTKLRLLLASTLLPLFLSHPADAATDPEGISQRIVKPEAVGHRFMAVTANPFASKAAEEILAAGGSAADAAIAAQLVLTLAEPQSSGLGGGGFLTWYDAKTRKLTVYDGRETAPAADKPDLFLGPDGQPLKFMEAAIGGKPVGVPGVVRLLEAIHKEHGKLPWARLFEPAIKLAEDGFAVTPRLNWWLTTARDYFISSPALRARFYNSDGSPLAVGQIYRNPDLAKSLRLIAAKGASAFYTGPLAKAIVDSVHEGMAVEDHPSPGAMTLADLAGYKIVERQAVCGIYRTYRICGAPPPAAGAVAIIETLGMLQRFDLAKLGPDNPQSYHLFAEASRRAFADRDAYIGDPAFVDVPVKGLIDPSYIAARAATIDPDRVASLTVAAGDPPGRRAQAEPDGTEEQAGTSDLSIVDAAGNGVSFTTTVNGPFGSHLMAGGFILNNQLLDFSFRPEIDGKPVPNRVEGGKRPRSSMAPIIVFDAKNRPRLLIGSPGGSKIIDYVGLAIIANLDWGMGIQQAVDWGHVVNTGTRTELEAGTHVADFAPQLTSMGHEVQTMSETSGLSAIAILPDGLHGGADGRREGVALGE
ncbi:MAG TPA: gamma-glutamyltransferase [Alphaproteobacteria bacterium]|nr:gamma-glutamyltransferase [Alphaproteobacteria bacterium]